MTSENKGAIEISEHRYTLGRNRYLGKKCIESGLSTYIRYSKAHHNSNNWKLPGFDLLKDILQEQLNIPIVTEDELVNFEQTIYSTLHN